jgi:hypothetical protein
MVIKPPRLVSLFVKNQKECRWHVLLAEAAHVRTKRPLRGSKIMPAGGKCQWVYQWKAETDLSIDLAAYGTEKPRAMKSLSPCVAPKTCAEFDYGKEPVIR